MIAWSIIPIFLLIAMGWGYRQTKFFWAELIDKADSFTYYVGFPMIIISSLATKDFHSVSIVNLTVSLVLAQLILAALAWLFMVRLDISGADKASVMQSQVRWNSALALALSGIFFGADGIAIMALAVAAMIPMANIITIWGFGYYLAQKRNLLLELARNPLVVACFIGIGINILGLGQNSGGDFLWMTLNFIGTGTIYYGLFSLGIGLNMRLLGHVGAFLSVVSLARLLLLPALAVVVMLVLEVKGLNFLVGLLATSSPTATSGYIYAKKLGGNAEMAAMLICLTHVFAVVTMPILFFLAYYFNGMG